jgi:CPA2 family monovalent cation:H+ antiporter-2
MLFDPGILVRDPGRVLAVLAVIVAGKAATTVVLVVLFGHTLDTAVRVGLGLAQIGEFSFILAALAVSLGIMPPDAQSLVLAGAILSIAVNPVLMRAVAPVRDWIGAQPVLARALDREADPLAELPASVDPATVTGHVLVVGHGRVGRRITEIFDRTGVRYVVADANRDAVASLRARGIHAVSGDASEPAVLIQGHVARARAIVLAVPDLIRARQMVHIARTLNPSNHVLLRTHNDAETNLLEAENLGVVFMGERELGAAMARYVVDRIGSEPAPAPFA